MLPDGDQRVNEDIEGLCGVAVIVAVFYGAIVSAFLTSLVWWLLT
jgi:hypothetical protein